MSFCDGLYCQVRFFDLEKETNGCETCDQTKLCLDCFLKALRCYKCKTVVCQYCMLMCAKCDVICCEEHCEEDFCESCDNDEESEEDNF